MMDLILLVIRVCVHINKVGSIFLISIKFSPLHVRRKHSQDIFIIIIIIIIIIYCYFACKGELEVLHH